MINLAPAEIPKHAASFDLPISLGILAASGTGGDRFDQHAVVGELSLDGLMRPAKGALSMAITAAAKATAWDCCSSPESAAEAAVALRGSKSLQLEVYRRPSLGS